MQSHFTESCSDILLCSQFLLLGTCGSTLSSQDISAVNVPSLDNIQQHPQSEDTSADTANLSGDPAATFTHDVPSSTSAEKSVPKNKSSDGLGSQSLEPSASGSSEPVGLGGGLIPKVLAIESIKCFSLLGFYYSVFILMLIISTVHMFGVVVCYCLIVSFNYTCRGGAE